MLFPHLRALPAVGGADGDLDALRLQPLEQLVAVAGQLDLHVLGRVPPRGVERALGLARLERRALVEHVLDLLLDLRVRVLGQGADADALLRKGDERKKRH